ncbi:hypothetical protein C5D04_17030 [Rathayibacter sp. AY1D2]|nr:hypothetical protein C5D04_17030 [Rathayibacter sp. AY1D2]
MQLQDVLDAPQLRLRVLVAGDGALARPVDGIFTTDLLDPRRYISRDQLVLTGLVWRRDAQDSAAFVAAVADSGASALLAGEGVRQVRRDRAERHIGRHGDQRDVVLAAGDDEVVRHEAQQPLAGEQSAGTRVRDRGDEGRAVLGVPTPDQTCQHQLVARDVAARIEEVGREDAVDRPGERPVAGDQHAQPQLRRVEDVLQLHQLPR